MPEGASWVREHSTPCNPELRLPVHEQKLQKHPNREEMGLYHLPAMWTHETHTRRKGLSRYPLRLHGLHHFLMGCVPFPFPGKSAAMTQGQREGSQYILRSVWSIWQPQARIHEQASWDGGTHSAGAPPTEKPRLSVGTGSPDGAVSPQQDSGEWITEVCCAVCEEVRCEQGSSCWKQQLLPTGVGNKIRKEEPAVHLETASSLGTEIFLCCIFPPLRETKSNGPSHS